MNPPRVPRLSLRSPLTSGLVLLGLSAAALGAPALQGKEERLSQRSFEVKGDYDAILGPGFEIMGEKVTPADLKRAIVVGTTGRNLLESAKLQVFMDEEIE